MSEANPTDPTLCPASGENTGKMEFIPGSDEWYICCPQCGMRWAGGPTVLDPHRPPGQPRL